MTMVASFMPSIAFAASSMTANDKNCWDWTVGSSTAVLKYATDAKGNHTLNAEAKVEYYTDDSCSTKHSPCTTTGKEETVYAKLTTVNSYDGGQISYVWPSTVKVTFPEHQFESVEKKAATCTEYGYATDANYCKNCKKYFNVDTGAVITDPDPVQLAKTSHKAVVASDDATVWGIDGTNVVLKKDAKVTCEDCGQVITVSSNVTKAKESGTVARTATCTKNGITGTDVTNVNDVTDKIVVTYVVDPESSAKAPHTYSSSNDNVSFVWNKSTPSAVATAGGCTVCGDGGSEVECKVVKTGTDPTCGTAGYVSYKATAYGATGTVLKEDTKSYYVKAADHDYVEVAEKPATCKDNGTKAHFVCSVCKKKFVKDANGDYVTTTDAALKIDRHHDVSATYTWPTDKEIKDVFLSKPMNDAFLSNKEITTGLKVKATDIKCKNCGFELKNEDGAVTKELPVFINGKEFAKLNEGKTVCDETIVLPVYVKDYNGTAIASDMYTGEHAKYTVHDYVVAGVEKSVGSVAFNHNINANAVEYVWDTKDSKNIKCDVSFGKCIRKKVLYNATTKTYAFATEVKDTCGKVSATQPATVTGKVTVEPTCTKNGEGVYRATFVDPVTKKTYDSGDKTIVLAKSEHKAEVIPAVAATVFTTGSKDGVKCSVCGEILTQPKEVAKLKVGTAKISSLKAGKKSFTVKASAANATGYRVYYKKAGAKKYSYTTVKAKNLSKTVKKLSAGKKYTVKVKAYAKNYDGDGEVVWGALSSGKTVKVK